MSHANAQERMRSLVAGDTTFLLCDTAILQLASMGGTDCWGWSASDGTDYAVMGTQNGLSFVSLATMSVVDQIAGPESGCSNSFWRDMVTYGHYLYCVSECSGTNQGLMVINLQYLPDSAHLIRTINIDPFGDAWSHNMAIDTVKGYAYLEGNWWAGSSVQIMNLANPESPVWVNEFGIGNGGIHDIYVMNDTAYIAEGSNGSFSIYDLTNKTSPQLLARVTIPNPGYVHNIWPTDDRRHVVTTEETAFHTVKIWNIENLANIQLSGEYLAPNNLAHNVHVVGNSTMFISHYQSGVAWVDISDPSNPRELVVYDTWVDEDPDFFGCWGVFPHT
ncbi:MAG: LVIVD repeat-containing protein, partial [Candidatus Zixiibacteriota bacterium]